MLRLPSTLLGHVLFSFHQASSAMLSSAQRHRSSVSWLCPFPCQPSSPSCLVSFWIAAIGSYCSANIHSGGTLHLPTPKSIAYLVTRRSFWIRPSLLCSWPFNGGIITLRMKSKLLYITYNILYHLVLPNSLASSGAILLFCRSVLALVIPLCPVKCFSSWDPALTASSENSHCVPPHNSS